MEARFSMSEHNNSLPEPDKAPQLTSDLSPFEDLFIDYQDKVWIRAIIQRLPGLWGLNVFGLVDTYLASIGARKDRERVEELFRHVFTRLYRLEDSQQRVEFVRTEDFQEAYRTCIETVTRSASEEKRRLVANYLAGTIEQGTITDLTQQMAEDLKALQPFHLLILSRLPPKIGDWPPQAIEGMDATDYEKGLSDLERWGFLKMTGGSGRLNGGRGHQAVTSYWPKFRQMALQDSSVTS